MVIACVYGNIELSQYNITIDNKHDIRTDRVQDILEVVHAKQNCRYLCGCHKKTVMKLVKTSYCFFSKMKGQDHADTCPFYISYEGSEDRKAQATSKSILTVKQGDKKSLEAKEKSDKKRSKSSRRRTFQGICLDVIDQSCVRVNKMETEAVVEKLRSEVSQAFGTIKLEDYEDFRALQQTYRELGENLYINAYITKNLSLKHGSKSLEAEELSYDMSIFDDERENIGLNTRRLDREGWLPKGEKRLILDNGFIQASEPVLREAIKQLFLFKNVIEGPYLLIEILHQKPKKMVKNKKYQYDRIVKRLYIAPIMIHSKYVLPVESHLERVSYKAVLDNYETTIYKPRSLSDKVYGNGLRSFFGNDECLIATPLIKFQDDYPDKAPIRPDLYMKISDEYFVIEIAGYMKNASDRKNEEYVKHLEFKENAFYQHMRKGVTYIRAYNEEDLVSKINNSLNCKTLLSREDINCNF